MAILLIDCYVDEAGGSPNFLPYLPTDTMIWKAVHEPLQVSVDDLEALVITGSAACVGDGDAWIEQLLSFLRKAIDRDVPCFGVCFGHQVLAHLCGADVGKMPTAEVGWKTIEILRDSELLSGISSRFGCFLSHEDGVLSQGTEIEVLAKTPDCAVQAFQHKHRPIFGIQFHPEMPLAETEALLLYRAEKHPELSLNIASEQKLLRSNQALAQKIFHNFLSPIRSA